MIRFKNIAMKVFEKEKRSLRIEFAVFILIIIGFLMYLPDLV